MPADEQRVRTMAGWIGVEISRSRVRTPGKAGYGLYRVRGSVGRAWIDTRELKRSAVTPDLHGERGEWTAYAFTLDEISRSVSEAISAGTPSRPAGLVIESAATDVRLTGVSTRWTSAYTGRRDLGVTGGRPPLFCPNCGQPRPGFVNGESFCKRCGWQSVVEIPATVRPEYAKELDALAALVDAGLIEMRHEEGCTCAPPDRYLAACIRLTKAAAMPRQLRRENSAAFQREHEPRRRWGKARYHAMRLGTQTSGIDGEAPPPALSAPPEAD